ncbi:probable glutamate receptor [Cherax quadricarinatus]|uniref:probable glutamate receptor n=1 Tax=Cherax quadricarinatus TaxID=27406 RepID=UPI00387E7C0B
MAMMPQVSVTLWVLMDAVTSVVAEVSRGGGWERLARVGANYKSPLSFRFPRAPHFLVAAEDWPPHVYLHTDPSGSIQVTGPMGQLLDALAASLNFTYSVVPGDGYWGAPQENGSWNGMIGTVLRKQADLGLGPFGMSYTRSEVVDFTIPVFLEMLHVLVSRPLPMPDPWGFLAPFTWYVWVALLVALLAIITTSVFIVRALGFGGPLSAAQHAWAFYSISFTQPVPWLPVAEALRFTFILWLFICLVVSRSYSGALTSQLAVKTLTVKYDSLRDVLDDHSLTLLMEGSTALTAHLQTATEGVYGELAQASRVRAKFVRATEMYEAAYTLIPDGRHAMLVENVVCRKIYSDFFSAKGRCNFYMSTDNFWKLIYAMVVQRGSPLRQLLNSRIRALGEFGIYDLWVLSQMPNMTHCLKTPRKVKFQEPYSMADLWALFLLLISGAVAAAAAFCCELLLPPSTLH